MRTFVIKKEWSDSSGCDYIRVYERYRIFGLIPIHIYKSFFFDMISLQTWIVKIKKHYGSDKVRIIVEPGALILNDSSMPVPTEFMPFSQAAEQKPNGGGKIDG